MKASRKERFTFKRTNVPDRDAPRPDELEEILGRLVAQAYLPDHPEVVPLVREHGEDMSLGNAGLH
jgi:hypothetical protein